MLVDLRSDTVTRPSAEMRRRMAAAEVGDDIYGEDPSVRALEERVASLLGKERALFVPSGTMSNQLALMVQTKRGDEIVIGHLGQGRKVRNLEADPRVVLTVEAEGTSGPGLANYLLITGTARLTPGGAPELLQELAGTYLGPGVRFPPMDDPPPGHVIHIRPERVGGVGPWVA